MTNSRKTKFKRSLSNSNAVLRKRVKNAVQQVSVEHLGRGEFAALKFTKPLTADGNVVGYMKVVDSGAWDEVFASGDHKALDALSRKLRPMGIALDFVSDNKIVFEKLR